MDVLDSVKGQGERPEFEYGDGVLSVNSKGERLRIQFSPYPAAKELNSKGEWRKTWPEFRIIPESAGIDLKDEAAISKRNAFEAFSNSIPHRMREIVEPFGSHQWMMLLMISGSREGIELAESNPVLAFALANSPEFRASTWREAEREALCQCREKQVDICEWLGFPGKPAVARLFKRIDTRCIYPYMLRRLRLALESDFGGTMKLLAHNKNVNAQMIDLVADPRIRSVITPNLIAEMGAAQCTVYLSLADQLFHAAELLQRMSRGRPRLRIKSIERAQRLIEEVDRQYTEYCRRLAEQGRERREQMRQARRERRRVRAENRARMGSRNPRARKWPPPPIPGTGSIIPLTSYDMLCEEAAVQNNCIRSYWDAISGGEGAAYAYRLLKPERATFMIRKRPGGDWALSEIKARSNQKVSAESRRAVESWLYAYNVSGS